MPCSPFRVGSPVRAQQDSEPFRWSAQAAFPSTYLPFRAPLSRISCRSGLRSSLNPCSCMLKGTWALHRLLGFAVPPSCRIPQCFEYVAFAAGYLTVEAREPNRAKHLAGTEEKRHRLPVISPAWLRTKHLSFSI